MVPRQSAPQQIRDMILMVVLFIFVLPPTVIMDVPVWSYVHWRNCPPKEHFVIPLVVLQMILSHSMNIAGSIRITSSILMIAPLAISIHMELMISMSE
jgi:hypothetical protein